MGRLQNQHQEQPIKKWFKKAKNDRKNPETKPLHTPTAPEDKYAIKESDTPTVKLLKQTWGVGQNHKPSRDSITGPVNTDIYAVGDPPVRRRRSSRDAEEKRGFKH